MIIGSLITVIINVFETPEQITFPPKEVVTRRRNQMVSFCTGGSYVALVAFTIFVQVELSKDDCH